MSQKNICTTSQEQLIYVMHKRQQKYCVFNGKFHMLTPGMLETTSKVTPQPGMVLLVDILLRKF